MHDECSFPQDLRGARVLVAEDEPQDQARIRVWLDQHGAHVHLATNGCQAVKEALQAWEKGHPFHVILMDMQMPMLDGFGATRRLREKGYPGPVIALVTKARGKVHPTCLNAGFNDFTLKPVKRHQLVRLVSQYTD